MNAEEEATEPLVVGPGDGECGRDLPVDVEGGGDLLFPVNEDERADFDPLALSIAGTNVPLLWCTLCYSRCSSEVMDAAVMSVTLAR